MHARTRTHMHTHTHAHALTRPSARPAPAQMQAEFASSLGDDEEGLLTSIERFITKQVGQAACVRPF